MSKSIKKNTKFIPSIEFEITKDSNRDYFYEIALFMEQELNIEFMEKLNGLDQFYWDFKFDGRVFILHLEHYLGISVFTHDISDGSKELLLKIKGLLQSKIQTHQQLPNLSPAGGG